MYTEKDKVYNLLPSNHEIEVFRLEDADNSLFANYQRYDFYQLIWFTQVDGDSDYFLDFNKYSITSNQLVLVFPGQIDMLNIKDKQGYIFAIQNESFFHINQRINSDYLNGYLSNIFLSPDKNITYILEQITQLILIESKGKNRPILMESYMEAFLFHVATLADNKQKNKSDFVIARLMQLIDAHFISQRETEYYADILGMTPKKINDACKKGTGKTVKQHLQERLILEAKREIRINQKSLKEIAFDLGFNEPAYFTRFFKQHTSLTPTEFKDS